MGKILFWVIIIIAALFVARLIAANKVRGAAPKAPPSGKAPAGSSSSDESMVRCAHCHIYLPRSEALQAQGKTWCSQEHAKLGSRPEPRQGR